MKKNLKPMLLLLGVFVLGGVAGAGAAIAVTRHQMADFAAHPWRAEKARLRAMTRKLDLTDDQQQKVRAVFERHRGERQQGMRRMFEECGAPMRAQKAAVDAEIRQLLTPPQRAKFDVIAKEQEQRFFRGGGGGRGRGGPPPPQEE